MRQQWEGEGCGAAALRVLGEPPHPNPLRQGERGLRYASGCHRSHRADRRGAGAVIDDAAIGEADDAVAALRQAGIVGDEDEGGAMLRLQREKQIDDEQIGRASCRERV